jgi:hypothetical protein
VTRLAITIEESELYKFAKEAHQARFPAFAWKAIACDYMGLPVGSRPTPAQMLNMQFGWDHLWLQLTLRFDQLTTVRWTEHLECEEERIHNTLRYLGATPDKVAQNLTMMGVMGTTMEACDCPLTHFFNGIYGAWFTKMFRGDVYVDFARCANPLAIENMVAAFDNGHLPKLDLFPDTSAVL